MSREIVEAVRGLAAEKNISSEKLMEALEDALLSAYKKTPGAAKYAKVEMDRDSGDFKVWELKIPEEIEAQLLVEIVDQESTVDPETGELREPPEPELDMEKLKEYEDQIETEDVTPHDFGRIAAQTAKQVILQRIREAERDMMFEEYRDRVGELITGIVQQSDSRYTLVQLRERVEALLPKSEQVEGERYDHSQRIKAVIKDVSNSTKGPSIIVSRRDPELIKQLFELEVPEIADGLVEITGVAREPGYRSKIAVVSHVDGVDPVGACVGPRGSRVRMVVSELRGEKIDIIPYNDEPARFVAKALSPARVREVLVDDAGKQATVIVPDDQLSLAIGREGQNARLAARLTGWRIDIRSETEFSAEEAAQGYDEEEISGRCHAILANGRRCPNAALPGSRYCGLPTHQALADQDTDQVAAAAIESAAAEPAGRGGAGHRMKQRVHEIAKERGLSSKDVLARLRAAGVEVKAASSSVDADVARKVLSRRRRRASAPPAAERAQAASVRAEPSSPHPRPRRQLTPLRAQGSPPPASPRSAEHKRPTRDSLQGERAPGAAGGRRRVVIDSQASRRAPGRRPAVQPAAAPPAARAPAARDLRRRGRVAAVDPDRGRRARNQDQLRLDRQGRRRVPQRLPGRDHQDADAAGRDEDAHPDADRRGDRRASRGARQGHRDRPRRG